MTRICPYIVILSGPGHAGIDNDHCHVVWRSGSVCQPDEGLDSRCR